MHGPGLPLVAQENEVRPPEAPPTGSGRPCGGGAAGEAESGARTGGITTPGRRDQAAGRRASAHVATLSRLAGHSNIAATQRLYSWTPGAAIEAITAA